MAPTPKAIYALVQSQGSVAADTSTPQINVVRNAFSRVNPDVTTLAAFTGKLCDHFVVFVQRALFFARLCIPVRAKKSALRKVRGVSVPPRTPNINVVGVGLWSAIGGRKKVPFLYFGCVLFINTEIGGEGGQ